LGENKIRNENKNMWIALSVLFCACFQMGYLLLGNIFGFLAATAANVILMAWLSIRVETERRKEEERKTVEKMMR
jgi:hypothetical protein